jgi:hypothetical protein
MITKWFSAILLCVAASCASLQSSGTSHTTNSYIEVDNGGWSDVVVYALINGSTIRTRIGDVSSLSVRRIDLSSSFNDRDVTFVVHQIAGHDYALEPVHLTTEEVVRLHVTNALNMTYIGIWKIE